MIKLSTLPPVTLASAGTATPVSTTSLRVTSLTIQSDKSNTASMYLGSDSVTVASGLEIVPGETAEVTADNVRAGSEEFDVSEIYLITGTSGQMFRAGVFIRRV